jgi:ABC-2 type transport system ATP-binding protein
VLENMRFFADAFGLPAAERAQLEARLLEFSRLGPYRNRRADALSGGMKQKLALACTLIHKPDVLMLDEPTQGLAPIVIRSLAETLRGLRGRFAMIVVEQNKAFLEGLADRTLYMRAGNLTEGAPA